MRATALYFGAALFLIILSGWSAAARDNRPGDFDYYALVLSWSPTYCASEPRAAREPQCAGPRPYAFVLHGLWPQYERGYPEFCRTRERPWVPRQVIDSMLDVMPSKPLIIHQYRKHGVCTGLDAARYYRLSRALFQRVTIPQRFREPSVPIATTVAQIERAFLKSNPDLRAKHVSVSCGRRGRLRELRICIDRDGAYRDCTRNESQRRLCRKPQIILPPVRRARR